MADSGEDSETNENGTATDNGSSMATYVIIFIIIGFILYKMFAKDAIQMRNQQGSFDVAVRNALGIQPQPVAKKSNLGSMVITLLVGLAFLYMIYYIQQAGEDYEVTKVFPPVPSEGCDRSAKKFDNGFYCQCLPETYGNSENDNKVYNQQYRFQTSMKNVDIKVRNPYFCDTLWDLRKSSPTQEADGVVAYNTKHKMYIDDPKYAEIDKNGPVGIKYEDVEILDDDYSDSLLTHGISLTSDDGVNGVSEFVTLSLTYKNPEEEPQCLTWTGLDANNELQNNNACIDCMAGNSGDYARCETECNYLLPPINDQETQEKTQLSMETCYEPAEDFRVEISAVDGSFHTQACSTCVSENTAASTGPPEDIEVCDDVCRYPIALTVGGRNPENSNFPESKIGDWSRERQFWRWLPLKNGRFKLCSYVHKDYCIASDATLDDKNLGVYNETYLLANRERYYYEWLPEYIPLSYLAEKTHKPEECLAKCTEELLSTSNQANYDVCVQKCDEDDGDDGGEQKTLAGELRGMLPYTTQLSLNTVSAATALHDAMRRGGKAMYDVFISEPKIVVPEENPETGWRHIRPDFGS